jgi:Secretion system C-terminal sorting domain
MLEGSMQLKFGTVVLMLCAMWSMTLAEDKAGTGSFLHSRPNGTPASTLCNVNNISEWCRDDAWLDRNPVTGNSGVTFPRGTATAIFQSGLIWGGKVYDGNNPTLRVGGQTYNVGTKPGAILGLRTGNTEDPLDSTVHIWRIRSDYVTADLHRDASEIFQVPLGSVTQAMIDSVRGQYARDWTEWPWEKGAPFYDLNGNGVKDPGEDPGLAGANLVVWFVCNDINAPILYGPAEIGLEEQVTVWAYGQTNALSNAVFRRYRVIYKGTASTSASAHIDSMYLSQWSDPDIGDSGDDFAGCDTTLNLVYAYNGGSVDNAYAAFGLHPPACGFDLLQGPTVTTGNPGDTAIVDFHKIPGARNMGATACIYFAAGGTYTDPPFNIDGAAQWYQMLRGLPPTPQGPPDPAPIINPSTGLPTSFWLSGDPVSGTGWVDGLIENPGDRRIIFCTGPFTMAVGDSQEIVVALVAGIGSNYLNSVTVLKSNDQVVQQKYNTLADIVTDVGERVATTPERFALDQNYPNPFNPTTRIAFSLPSRSFVSLEVYDPLGRIVATLVHAELAPGSYEKEFNGNGLASGIYFYRLHTGSFTQTRKLMLLK